MLLEEKPAMQQVLVRAALAGARRLYFRVHCRNFNRGLRNNRSFRAATVFD
jgi:hypothetical protein